MWQELKPGFFFGSLFFAGAEAIRSRLNGPIKTVDVYSQSDWNVYE